jgi:transcriptional regulator with XRE-family HTH domain
MMSAQRVVVPRWTGDEVWRLRTATRMTVRSFAGWLGVSDRMVSKWEGGTVPGPVNQAALDTALRMCSDVETRRFWGCPPRPTRRDTAPEPVYESTRTPKKRFGTPEKPLPASLWDDQSLRAALREHNIGYLFKVLQHHRVSQRTIARMVGMQQSEISEILAGRRVRQYEALLRICLGLRIPRHLMGLSDTEPPAAGTMQFTAAAATTCTDQPTNAD